MLWTIGTLVLHKIPFGSIILKIPKGIFITINSYWYFLFFPKTYIAKRFYKMSDKLFIIIPAYNEEANIETVAREWHEIAERYGNDSRLVIIDDGSRDATFQKLQQIENLLPRLTALTKQNSGHGSTVLYGYNYALSQNADFIFQTDSDGQTLPAEFEQFWNERNDFDLLIGYRKNRRDGISRIFVTRTLRLVLRLCFGVYVQDANTPFRLMSVESLRQNLAFVPADFNLSNVILTVVYTKKKQSIKYFPITFRERQGGKNSINLCRIIKIGFQTLKDFWRINKNLENELK